MASYPSGHALAAATTAPGIVIALLPPGRTRCRLLAVAVPLAGATRPGPAVAADAPASATREDAGMPTNERTLVRAQSAAPLDDAQLDGLLAYWDAANYLTVAQIYLGPTLTARLRGRFAAADEGEQAIT